MSANTFDLQNIKILHLEPTTVCNAACPQCPRTFKKFTYAELSLGKCKSLFSQQFIGQLTKMFMCGNYGDPAAARDTLQIFQYFKSVNPNITLGMNTNGSIRSPKWWGELASVLNGPRDWVTFSIDGLEDTNHIYRINTQWYRIMENAEAFISAGGQAHWDMLVFEHNEHQVEQALKLANKMKFNRFQVKVSRRHKSTPIPFLKPPKNYKDPVIESTDIKCRALAEQSIYVDAMGKWHPCCWQGFQQSDYDLSNRFNELIQSWTNTPNRICKNTCGVKDGNDSFGNQFQKTIIL